MLEISLRLLKYLSLTGMTVPLSLAGTQPHPSIWNIIWYSFPQNSLYILWMSNLSITAVISTNWPALVLDRHRQGVRWWGPRIWKGHQRPFAMIEICSHLDKVEGDLNSNTLAVLKPVLLSSIDSSFLPPLLLPNHFKIHQIVTMKMVTEWFNL